MPIHISIQIRLSDRQRQVVRMATVCGAVIGALGLGVAVAAPNYTFVNGQKLSSSQMTENFSDLQARIAVLEARPTLGVPAGSTSPTNGKFVTADGLTGYRAARKLCQDAVQKPSAHMCTADEMARAAQAAQGTSPPAGWYASGTYAIHDVTRPNADCLGWTSSAGNLQTANFWEVSGAQSAPFSDACDALRPIICCN